MPLALVVKHVKMSIMSPRSRLNVSVRRFRVRNRSSQVMSLKLGINCVAYIWCNFMSLLRVGLYF